jgi:enoyl-CoA hydratase/carnithine racemase
MSEDLVLVSMDDRVATVTLNRPDALLPTCEALARDILSTEPVTCGEIKRIMDAGWESTLGDGMQIEALGLPKLPRSRDDQPALRGGDSHRRRAVRSPWRA